MRGWVRTVEDFFVKNRERFIYLHMGMLIIFAALIFITPFLPLPAEDATLLNNFTLLAKFLIWGLWFPLMLLSVVFFGRLWCGLLCPQGALREYALAAMEILGGTMIVAIIIGFLYTSGRRPWCRYLCPIGPLLGIFSRLGALSFDRNGGSGKGCVCPTFINTATKVASSNCIECFRCVSPDVNTSLHLKMRRPGLEIEEIEGREPGLWEVIFLFAATGLALGAFHWQVNPIYIQYKQALGGLLLNLGMGDFIGKSGPWWLMVYYPEAGEVFNYLDIISITSFMIVSMVCTAAILLILTALSAFILRKKQPIMATVARLGYLYAPVALVSLMLGLGLILFQSLGDLGLSKTSIRIMQVILFGGGGIWSAYLAVKLHGRWGLALIPNVVGTGFVAVAWYKVLF